jgi:hypothetical protein
MMFTRSLVPLTPLKGTLDASPVHVPPDVLEQPKTNHDQQYIALERDHIPCSLYDVPPFDR